MGRLDFRNGTGWTAMSAAVAVGAVVVSGVGVADAAVSYFVLGAKNSETQMATLTNANGTPLSLQAKAGTPPLQVNSSNLVGNLNAQFLGGLPASALQQRSFTAAGTTAVTVPTKVSHVYAVMVGGGGAGDSVTGTGCGGGQGASVSLIAKVTPGERLDVVVGAGGVVGGSNGTDAGGASSVGPHNSPTWADAFGGDSGATDSAGAGNDWGGPGTLPVAEAPGADGNCVDHSGGGAPSIAGSGGGGGYTSSVTVNPAPGTRGYVLLTFEK